MMEAPMTSPGAAPASAGSAAEERVSVASQWQLMWWRFRKHRLAVIATVVIIVFYLIALGADFLAYADPEATEAFRALIPPQPIHVLDQGRLSLHVHGLTTTRDPYTMQRVYAADPNVKIPVRLFAPGFKYKLFGVIPANRHLFGVRGADPQETLFILGTDMIGRDAWTRLVYGTRVSLSIGLVAVALSLLLGVFFGGISGLYGGLVDTVIQRIIEVLRSVPTIPLWMGLTATLPRDWDVTKVYFVITVILSLIGWTELARVVRGRFMALREEDFVMAAELAGCGRLRIIFRHMVPSFLSHIIAAITLALPGMIVSETALSFLGVGLRAPAISWGVLLQQAQNLQTVALSPWLMIPAIPVVVVILSFNFVGDGLRDAADPYGV